MDEALAKKLLLHTANRAALVKAPEGFAERLTPLPEQVRWTDRDPDWSLVFCRYKAEVDALVPQAIREIKPGGVLWLAYQKGGTKVQTDINRDTGWDAARALGWRPVTQVALDDTWSALRFRPESDVKTKGSGPR